MKRNLVVTLLVMLAVLSLSCRGTPIAYAFEVFEGGENIRQVQLKKESAIQLSYKISLVYPDKSVLNFYKESLPAAGWKRCGPEGEWVEQLKKDQSQIKGVRQFVSYAIHEDTNRLLMISLQYFSDPVSQVSEKMTWHDQAQYVTLVAYNVENFDQVLHSLSLTCSARDR